MSQQLASRSFDNIMRESVVNGLTYSLGKGGETVIERTCDLNAASAHPSTLHSMLSSFFNDVGASVLERQILRQLYDEIGERYVETPGDSFESHVNQARSLYESQKGRAR